MEDLKKEFSKIYDLYVERIYRFVFLKVNSKEIAEDLTSETFLRAWQSFQKKRSKIKNFQAFLYQIAKNLITDFYRKKEKPKIVTLENIEISLSEENPQKKAFLENEIEKAIQALGKLKSDYQDVIIWYYLEGLKVQEIAQILDKSERATRTMICRALNSLREIFEKNCNKN